jgi:L-ascorbate metabolism protein UlaG (beta-lactamase superfamily)
MSRIVCSAVVILMAAGICAAAEGEKAMETKKCQEDTIKTASGDLKITFIGHGTLMFEFGGKVIQVDPWSKLADYSKLPKADIVLVTHGHQDHLDPEAIKTTRKDGTVIVISPVCEGKVPGAQVLKNGETTTVMGLKVEVVPAYNIEHKRPDGSPFHPKGEGNGYVITFVDKRIYVAGDTENTPEMKALKNIDVAFLPMNLPYTMTPEMVADAARAFKPAILYPYHFGKTDTQVLVGLLKDTPDVEVRVRKME